jgi:hypothetical protein
MVATLTCALFMLVGIAGEDDLDVPDLLSPKAPETKNGSPRGNNNEHLNGIMDSLLASGGTHECMRSRLVDDYAHRQLRNAALAGRWNFHSVH